MWFDGSSWNALVKLDTGSYACTLYTHDLSSSLTSGWTVRKASFQPFDGQANVYPKGFWQQYVRTGKPTITTFTFETTSPNGPTITSPSNRSLLFYQYIPISPIVVSATGVGTLYYFVESATLPDGIVFDPLTATFSGTSVVLGSVSFTVYVKDDNGVTSFTIGTTTVLPTVQKQQSGAGAWTYLLRQYTEVNAATTSRDNKVTPVDEYKLGEFLRPNPPDVLTDSNCPC